MSGRGLSAPYLTALDLASLSVFIAVKLALTSGTFAFKSGSDDLTFDGVTFKADGTLISVGKFTESRDMSATDVPMTLALTDDALITALLANNSTNDEVDFYFGLMTSPGTVLAYQKFGPFLFAKPMIPVNPVSPAAAISCSRYTYQLDQINDLMFTDEDQQDRHSGDKFFSLINTLAYKQMIWGGVAVGQSVKGSSPTGGSGTGAKPVGGRPGGSTGGGVGGKTFLQ